MTACAQSLRRLNGQRGAILVESAIVASTILTLMLGMIDFGLLGFLQITIDAGTFLNAHENVMLATNPSSTANPNQLMESVFPQIQATSIGTPYITEPSPGPTVYVNYGYNDPAATPNPNMRHGGASIMVPYNDDIYIAQKAFSLLREPFWARSSSTEPLWLDAGAHWDVNDVNYGGQAYSNPNLPTSFDVNYFTLGDNSPVFYTGFNFMHFCSSGSYPWNTCSSNNTTAYVLGVAEFLTLTNNTFEDLGINGAAPTTSSGTPTYTQATGIFEALACHQRVFAQLAQALSTMVGTQADPYTYLQTNYTIFSCNQNPSTTNCGNNTIHSPRNLGNFENAGNFKFTGSGATADTQIFNIYNWDVGPGNTPYSTSPYSGNDITTPYEACV